MTQSDIQFIEDALWFYQAYWYSTKHTNAYKDYFVHRCKTCRERLRAAHRPKTDGEEMIGSSQAGTPGHEDTRGPCT